MALMQLTIVPVGSQNVSISEFVADIQEVLKTEKANFQLTDMGTIILGNLSELLILASKLSELPFKKGIKRVLTQITIDDRRDKKVQLGDKVASVEAQIS